MSGCKASAAHRASCLGKLHMDVVATCLGYVEDERKKAECSYVCHMWRDAAFFPKSWKHTQIIVDKDSLALPLTIIERFGSGMLSLSVEASVKTTQRDSDSTGKIIYGAFGKAVLELLDAISAKCTGLQELELRFAGNRRSLVFVNCREHTEQTEAMKSEIQGRVVAMVQVLAERCGGRMAAFSTDLLDIGIPFSELYEMNEMMHVKGLYEKTDVEFGWCHGCQNYKCEWTGLDRSWHLQCTHCRYSMCRSCCEEGSTCSVCHRWSCELCALCIVQYYGHAAPLKGEEEKLDADGFYWRRCNHCALSFESTPRAKRVIGA